jgi:hypothetical protein
MLLTVSLSRGIRNNLAKERFRKWFLSPSLLCPLDCCTSSRTILPFEAVNAYSVAGSDPLFRGCLRAKNAVRRYRVAPGHIDSCRFYAMIASPRHSRRCFRKLRVKCSERAIYIDSS